MKRAITCVLILLGGVVILFLIIQLVPISTTNPPVVTQVQWDSTQTQALFARACADCHSYETVWPWYSHVAPASWLVAFDVARGRRSWNISDPSSGRETRSGTELARVIQKGSMPPLQYLILHPNANLTSAEKQALINGLEATFP